MFLQEFPENVNRLTIGCLHFEVRTRNVLVDFGINTIGDLFRVYKNNFQGIQRLGDVSKNKIIRTIDLLVDALNSDKEVNWGKFYHSLLVKIIPEIIDPNYSKADIFFSIPKLARIVLSETGDDREWRIVQRRFGLEGTQKMTLDDLSNVYGLTRERIRQLEKRSLIRMREIFIENEYSGKDYHINPVIISLISELCKGIRDIALDFTTEEQLINKISELIECEISEINETIILFLEIVGLERIVFPYSNLQSIWGPKEDELNERITKSIQTINSLLTEEVIRPLEEFDVLLRVNRDLPKNNKLSIAQLKHLISLCSTVEYREDGLVWGKFEFLANRGDQVERVLILRNMPISLATLAREINSKLVPYGFRKVNTRNLSNIISKDKRFIPIGKSSIWGLSSWDHISSENVISLMETYLLSRNQPATPREIFDFVSSKRPVSAKSITLYLYMSPNFKKADKTKWGLADWPELEKAILWSPEEVAGFVEELFKKNKTKEIEYKKIRDALMKSANVTSKQAQGMLNRNPVIKTKRTIGQSTIAVFNPEYKKEIGKLKITFSGTRKYRYASFEDIVKKIITREPGKQIELGKLVNILANDHKFIKRTCYQYISKMNSLEKFTIPGSTIKICRLKGSYDLVFPQIKNISDKDIQEQAERAINKLTIDDVDIGLFLLGRLFEMCLKKFMLKAESSGKYSVTPKNYERLAFMIDWVKNQGIIADVNVLHFLRQERNDRAHGVPPSLEERQVLLNSAVWITNLYLDYIILFYNRLDNI